MASEWAEVLSIGDRQISFKLDSGAQTNIIPYDIFNELKCKAQLQTTDVKLRSYFGHIARPEGQTQLLVELQNGVKQMLTFQVMNKGAPILGKESCEALSLLKRCKTNRVDATDISVIESCSQGSYTDAKGEVLLHEYSDVFEGLGLLKKHEYDIQIDPTVLPVQKPPRNIPYKLRDAVKQELDRMERMGVHVKETEPTE